MPTPQKVTFQGSDRPFSFLIFAIGLSIVTLLTTCNTILQSIVEDGMRGRLLSLYAMTFLGLAPLGGLLSGTLTNRLGVEMALQIAGTALLIGAAGFGLSRLHLC